MTTLAAPPADPYTPRNRDQLTEATERVLQFVRDVRDGRRSDVPYQVALDDLYAIRATVRLYAPDSPPTSAHP